MSSLSLNHQCYEMKVLQVIKKLIIVIGHEINRSTVFFMIHGLRPQLAFPIARISKNFMFKFRFFSGLEFPESMFKVD